MKKNILVIQKYIAPFRIPVFQELNKCDDHSFTFLSATSTFAPKCMADVTASGINHSELKLAKFSRYLWLYGVNPKKRNANVVILESSLNILSNPFLMIKCKLLGIPVILWTKGMRQNRQPRKGLNRLYEKFCFSLASKYIVYGKSSKDDLLSKKIPAEKIYVAQNTVKTDHLLSLPNTNDRLGEKALTFGYMGRLEADKNVLSIIKSFQKFIAKDSNADHKLVIAGAGPEKARLEKYVEEYKLNSHVSFLGRVPDSEVTDFFQKIDVYLSYSAHGLGIIEAMAAAKVILITPEFGPETEGIIHLKTGIISDDLNEVSFTDSMNFINSHRDELFNLPQNARSYCQKYFSLSSMINPFISSID